METFHAAYSRASPHNHTESCGEYALMYRLLSLPSPLLLLLSLYFSYVPLILPFSLSLFLSSCVRDGNVTYQEGLGLCRVIWVYRVCNGNVRYVSVSTILGFGVIRVA